EAEPGLAVAARVSLAGTGVDRPSARVVRVDGERADRVRRDVGRDLLPVRLLGKCVVRPPDAAARGADEERAVTVVRTVAHRHGRLTAGPLRGLDERLRAELVDVERVGSDRVPLREGLRALLLELVVRLDRALDLRRRDLRGGVRTVGV